MSESDEVSVLRATIDRAAAALNVALAHAEGRVPYAKTHAESVEHEQELAGCWVVLDEIASMRPFPATPADQGERCPIHGIPDCSSLLNGCSFFTAEPGA